MPNETKIIRDFIYMDVERLNSLYSQVFGGVVPQILKSSKHEKTGEANTQEKEQESLQEVLTRTLVTAARHETKNVILYDYLYTQFEDGIADSILEPQGLTRSNFVSVLKSAFLVKVEGNVEIEDYERLAHTSERFLELASDIAWVSSSGAAKALAGLMELQVQELQQQAKNTTGRERERLNSQITDLQREVKEYQDPEKLRKKLVAQIGVDVDPGIMQGVARLFRHFTPNNFEVTILPSYGPKEIVFRGILDKQLLRVQPEYLRVLYEGTTTKKWTMVGEITHLPDTNQAVTNVVAPTDDVAPNEDTTQNNAAMKDALRGVFKSFANMENTFFKSEQRVEVRLRPLAIYQKSEIQVRTQQPTNV